MKTKLLLDIYRKLFDYFGPQYWWPADTKEEIVIGAILTQNTAWINVEKAIKNLKESNMCTFESIYNSKMENIAKLIKPAGFFKQKSLYLKNVSEFFLKEGGFNKMSNYSTRILRSKLLKVKGIGKETADSILLYAFERPIFVIDSYTKRLVKRHNLYASFDYDNLQEFFMSNLPIDVELFKDYHALIVKNAKEFCRKNPQCYGCPLEEFL